MVTTVDARPERLPDEFEHVELTREEVQQALDQEARRLFNLTADDFIDVYRDPPEQYHGDPVFSSLCFLADLIAEPSPA